MTLWLKADVGVTTSGGTNVTAWNDQSGNGNNATPPSLNPLLQTASVGGRAAIRFSGSDQLTFASFTAGLTALEGFVVAKNADDGATSVAVWAFTDDVGTNLTPFATDRKIYDDTGSTTRQTTGFAPAAGAWSSPWLYNVIATGSEWTALFNGAQVFTQASNTFGYGTKAIGKGTGLAFVGDIAEVVLYPAKLSAPNRALATTTLKSWYGIP